MTSNINISRTCQGTIIIRRANKADVARLLYISRKCFPYDILYQGVRWHGEKWWKVVIMSEAADTYVAERDSRVVAFAVLDKNEDLWNKERKKRHNLLVVRFLSRIVCPMLAAGEIRRKVSNLMKRSKNCPRKPLMISSYDQTKVELLAVLPEEQGHGIAKQLLRECESRTKALRRKVIVITVLKTNLPAIRLYEKMGYELSGESSQFLFHVKALDSLPMKVEK